MPDFNQPRMKKPELVLVKQESGRTVRLQLLSKITVTKGKIKGRKKS